MNIVEIENALEMRNMERIEWGFASLVAGRSPLTGVANVQDVFDVLDRVTAALEANRNCMPSELAAAICSVPDTYMTVGELRSFADGARIVAAHNHHWRKGFDERLRLVDDTPSSFDSRHDVLNSSTE